MVKYEVGAKTWPISLEKRKDTLKYSLQINVFYLIVISNKVYLAFLDMLNALQGTLFLLCSLF